MKMPPDENVIGLLEKLAFERISAAGFTHDVYTAWSTDSGVSVRVVGKHGLLGTISFRRQGTYPRHPDYNKIEVGVWVPANQTHDLVTEVFDLADPGFNPGEIIDKVLMQLYQIHAALDRLSRIFQGGTTMASKMADPDFGPEMVKALEDFFHDYFDRELVYAGYMDAIRIGEPVDQIIKEIDEHRYLKLALIYGLVTPEWIESLKSQVRNNDRQA